MHRVARERNLPGRQGNAAMQRKKKIKEKQKQKKIESGFVAERARNKLFRMGPGIFAIKQNARLI